MKLICRDCGAEFDSSEPKCPFCGSFNLEGAEKEYMEKLEDIREDMDDLSEDITDTYKDEMKEQFHFTRKIVLRIVIILAVIGAIFLAFRLYEAKAYSYDPKAALLFQKEAYPKADAFFAAGDYDGLLEFCQTCTKDNPNADFSDWEHFGFLYSYEYYTDFMERVSDLKTGDFSSFDVSDMIFIYLAMENEADTFTYTEEELTLVQGYRLEITENMARLEMTSEEEQAMEECVLPEGFPSWDQCEKLGKKIYKRLK